MSILGDFNKEIIDAYKSGDSKKRVLLQTLKAALIKAQKDAGGDLSAEDEQRVLKSELKIREQSRSDFESGNRDDLVKEVDEEIAMLKSYLPEQADDDKITDTARSVIGKLDNPDFGQAMKAVMAELKGQADGARVASIVKDELND